MNIFSTINSTQSRTSALLALVLFLFIGISACDDDDEDDPVGPPQESNIVETAQATDDLSTLAGAVVDAGLADALSADGPFTVFAPSNAAFDALPDGLLESLSNEQLATVLQYHATSGAILSGDLSAEQTVPALTEEPLYVTADGGVTVNGGASVTTADVEASNGVVHIIDQVLLPNQFLDIVQIAQKNYNLTSLVGAVSDAGLVETLSGDGPFTVFAPNNAAFEAASETIASLSEEQIAEVLQYHVAAAEALSTDLSDGQTIETVQEEEITVAIDGDGNVTLNGSVNVVAVDQQGTNGVVHIIDGVLVPPSLQ